jgi:hypothetical protein
LAGLSDRVPGGHIILQIVISSGDRAMHRLHTFLALAATAALAAAMSVAVFGSADAKEKKQYRGQQRPQVIIRDRYLYGPPPPPSSDRNYYGPAPGIQAPMERVPLPAPLAQPPTNR